MLDRIAAWLGVSVDPVHIPSDEADVYRLGAFVVKIERFEGLVAREAVALPALRARGFAELPEVVMTHDDLDEDGPPFTVMVAAPGGPLSSLSPNRQRDVVERIADVLRRMAPLDWRTVPGAWSPVEKQSSYRDWMIRHIGGEHDALRVLDERPGGFGGWQFAQLLADEHGSLTMIDWGAIGAHWPVSDVVTTLASLDEIDTSLRRVFLDAYGPIDAEEVSAWERYWELL